MDSKEKLLKELSEAYAAVAMTLNYPKLLQVEEYADLTASMELIHKVYKRLLK